jgi:uncharacterized hydantoinase/oxoprolinase family protein
LLGELPENLEDHGTADGRAASLDCAHARLARMVGADVESLSLDEARRLAQAVADRQAVVLASALTQVVGTLPAPPGRIILSGSGEFLARRALRRFNPELAAPVVALSDSLGPVSSGAACAVAVSRLAVALVR